MWVILFRSDNTEMYVDMEKYIPEDSNINMFRMHVPVELYTLQRVTQFVAFVFLTIIYNLAILHFLI